MKLSVKKVKVFEEMSEETPCFTCDLYDDGKLVAHVSNHGHGGNNMISSVTKSNKDVLKYEDMDVECEIFDLVEKFNITTKKQSNNLVIEKDGDIFLVKLKASIKKLKEIPTYEKGINGLIKKYELQGYTILNRNL